MKKTNSGERVGRSKSVGKRKKGAAYLNSPYTADALPIMLSISEKRLFDESLAAHQRGAIDVARIGYIQLLNVHPKHADSLHLLGVIALTDGDLPEAERLVGEAQRLNPNSAVYCNNYGEVLRLQKNYLAARAYYEKALQIWPNYADAFNNLGSLASDEGDNSDAVRNYNRSLEIDSNSARAWYNLGSALHKTKRYAPALQAFDKSLALEPNAANTWNNLGLVQYDLERVDDAISSYRRALALSPEHADAAGNLGSALLLHKKDYLEARALINTALSVRPDHALTRLVLATLHGTIGDLESCQTELSRVDVTQLEAGPRSNLLFMSNYASNLSAEGLLQRYRDWDEAFGRLPNNQLTRVPLTPPSTDWHPGQRRLRIGYLSPDFKNHSVHFFLEPVLANHDASVVDVFAYANVLIEDNVTQRLKTLIPNWRDVSGMTDGEAAAQIRADGIDVLIDTAGHTADHRLKVFAYRPAPVQLSWLIGYGYTTGLTAMDFILGDEQLTPPETDPYFAEKVYRLNRPCMVYRPPTAPPLTQSPHRHHGVITLGSLSRIIRITDETIHAWVEIVRRIGRARIYLDQPSLEDTTVALTIRQRFEKLGLPATQLVLGYRKPYWSAYQEELDITLDPFPHNAGTTTLESLWMGVPVVSLCTGKTSLGRFGAAMLPEVGHADWLTYNVGDYIACAVALAKDTTELSVLRTSLRSSMLASRLMDERGLAAAMEDAFADMYTQVVNSKKHMPATTAASITKLTPLEAEEFYADTDATLNPHGTLSAQSMAEQLQAMLIAGKSTEAISYAEKFIDAYPTDHRAHMAHGIAQRQLYLLPGAIASYRKALELAPTHLPSLLNLARAQALNGDYNEAANSAERAVLAAPDNAAAFSQLSYIRFFQKRLPDAEVEARRAISIDNQYLDGWQNLGNALRLMGRTAEARAAFETTLKLDPKHIDGYVCLGSILKDYADTDTALQLYEMGTRHATDLSHAIWSNYFFVLNYAPHLSAQEIAGRYFEWGKAVQKQVSSPTTFSPCPTDLHKPIRVGLLSGDFNTHVIRYFVYPWLERIGRDRQVFILYNNGKIFDQNTLRFKSLADEWHDVAYLTDDQLQRRIVGDRIDVLIDLSGHTSGNRLNVFARRAAPCQVSWIGIGYTTGLTNIDYFFADERFVPKWADHLFAEKIVRWPFIPFAYQLDGPNADVSPLPALRNGFVTFGCMSRAVRLNERVISAWAKILLRLPTARLRLDHPQMLLPELKERLQRQFADAGVFVEQVIYAATRPHWPAFGEIDIALDPFPHNAGTTTIEALYMGLPVVSLMDRPSVGRFGAMFLHAVDMDEWAVNSEAEYVEFAVKKAGDVPALDKLRRELRLRVDSSPLLDGQNLAEHFSKSLEMMWHNHCNGLAANAFHVPALPKTTEWVRERTRGAVATLKAGNYGLAAHLFKQILLFNPEEHTAWLNLGACHKFQGNNIKAIECFGRAVAVSPDYVSGWYNLGVACQDSKQYVEAEAAYQRVISLDPTHDQAMNNLGVICKEQSRGPEALTLFKRALEIHPNKPVYLNNLGNLYEVGDQPFKAMRVLQKALDIEPGNPLAHTNLGIVYRKLAMFEDAMAEHAHFPLTLGANFPLLFTLNYHPDLTSRQIYEHYERECTTLNKFPRCSQVVPKAKEKLKVGFIGADFRNHAAAKFLMPLLHFCDASRVELFAFANQAKSDVVSELMQKKLRWIDVLAMDDQTLCDEVKRLGIDILIDLAGWTGGNRLTAMAMKPAPVQATWLGYGYTTGLTAIDWFIGDALLTPQGVEEFFSEKIYRMPNQSICFHGLDGIPEVTSLPALNHRRISFGHLGRPMRINQRVVAVWAEILKRLPDSRLILDNQPFADPEVCSYFKEKFVAAGARPDQLVLRHSRPHWGSFADIDIALDPFPHNAGTTTVEALLMGVPVLSKRDRAPLGRFGDCLLHAVGLDDWVCDTQDQYVEKAVRWAENLAHLATLRQELRGRFLSSTLADGPGFATDFTNALFAMWQDAVERQS